MDMNTRIREDIANMEEACRIRGGSSCIIYSAVVLISDIAYIFFSHPAFTLWFLMLGLLNTVTYALHRRIDTFSYERGNTAFLKTYVLMMVLSMICKLILNVK